MSYLIVDNFLPKSVQDMLWYRFQWNTLWQYASKSSGEGEVDENDSNVLEISQFTHLSIHSLAPKMTNLPPPLDVDTSVSEPLIEESYNDLRIVLYFLEFKFKFKIDSIYRIKTNMGYQMPHNEGLYPPPHFDANDPNMIVAIYYINDSDGPTRLFNKTTHDKLPHKDLKVIAEIEPKQGRAVLFKANRMHTGCSPIKHENRIVSNLVFTSKNLDLEKLCKENQ